MAESERLLCSTLFLERLMCYHTRVFKGGHTTIVRVFKFSRGFAGSQEESSKGQSKAEEENSLIDFNLQLAIKQTEI